MMFVKHANRYSISELIPKLLDFDHLKESDKLFIDLFEVIREQIINSLAMGLGSINFEVLIY